MALSVNILLAKPIMTSHDWERLLVSSIDVHSLQQPDVFNMKDFIIWSFDSKYMNSC